MTIGSNNKQCNNKNFTVRYTSVTAKYFMVFVFLAYSLKFLCSNHMMAFLVIFCGYVFPRTVNETKKAIILCIS